MQTLVIDHKESQLTLRDQRVRIEVPNQKPQFVPVAMVSRLVVTTRVWLHTSVIGALTAAGASILVLSPRDHRKTAIITPPLGRDHALRLQQYRSACDAEKTAMIAAAIVGMKLRGQLRTLRKLNTRKVAWRAAVRGILELLPRLAEPCALETIRGIEGGGAAMYFKALGEALPNSLEFHKRQRRPPPDPVNALLSLSYTLLHFEAVRITQQAGFDACIGFLHAPEYSRESLACDCIEPLRPVVDGFVLGLFHSRIIRKEHFGVQQDSCKLRKTGRGIFYRHWEQFAKLPRKVLHKGVILLRKTIQEKTK